MKKVIILFAALAAMASCKSTGGAVKLKSDIDSVAYIYGLDFGRFIKGIDSTMNLDAVARGMRDVIEGNTPLIPGELGESYLNEYFRVTIPARNKKASEEFLAGVKANNANAKVTESGLIYEVISEGTGKAPVNAEDQVKVHYTLYLPDGQKLQSSLDYGEPATFALGGVIPGWTEALKLMKEGGKMKLWIPSELGYGEQGNYGDIKGNQALVFDVELLEVTPAEKAAE